MICYILKKHDISPSNNDQSHFHDVYVDKVLRKKFDIKLDHRSELVYNVFAANNEGEIQCNNGTTRLA